MNHRFEQLTYLTALSVVATLILDKDPIVNRVETMAYHMTHPLGLGIVHHLLRGLTFWTNLSSILGSLSAIGISVFKSGHVDIFSPSILFVCGIGLFMIHVLLEMIRLWFELDILYPLQTVNVDDHVPISDNEKWGYFLSSVIPMGSFFVFCPVYITLIHRYSSSGSWF